MHCHAGKDRTGIVTALLLSVAAVKREAIIEDYALSDRELRPLYRIWVKEEEPDPALRRVRQQRFDTPPQAMAGLLAHLHERYGGPERYLLGTGLDPGTLRRLRARLGPGRPRPPVHTAGAGRIIALCKPHEDA